MGDLVKLLDIPKILLSMGGGFLAAEISYKSFTNPNSFSELLSGDTSRYFVAAGFAICSAALFYMGGDTIYDRIKEWRDSH